MRTWFVANRAWGIFNTKIVSSPGIYGKEEVYGKGKIPFSECTNA